MHKDNVKRTLTACLMLGIALSAVSAMAVDGTFTVTETWKVIVNETVAPSFSKTFHGTATGTVSISGDNYTLIDKTGLPSGSGISNLGLSRTMSYNGTNYSINGDYPLVEVASSANGGFYAVFELSFFVIAVELPTNGYNFNFGDTNLSQVYVTSGKSLDSLSGSGSTIEDNGFLNGMASSTSRLKGTPAPASDTPLTVQTNGLGGISPNDDGKLLEVGKTYTLKAIPARGYLFSDWVGGTVFPYSVLSTTASYKFTMQSNLVLQADFVPNLLFDAQGAYYGLFEPTNSVRRQTNSGAFNFTLTSGGAFSGKLQLGSQTVPLHGKFGVDGSAQSTSTGNGESALTTSLQLDFANQAVAGTVSNGNFVAQLTGYQDVFSSTNKATAYEGRYTLNIPGTTNPAVGPYGASYGTVTVGPLGNITFVGSLADGTPVSQSSVLSQDGLWPFYLPLYGGKGSLWSWNNITNQQIVAVPAASWINGTNSSKAAVYRSGFTNQAVALAGSFYDPSSPPLQGAASGEVTLTGGGLPAITNTITISSNNVITVTSAAEKTNKLALRIDKATGAISGAFANPSNPRQTIKVNGVLLQNQAGAAGYFLGANQSGAFELTP